MTDADHITRATALLEDQARASLTTVLLNGRARTAKELSFVTRMSAQTTVAHLGRLTEAGLLRVERQGRHRYFRIDSALVARMLEGILAASGPPTERPIVWRGGEALRNARTCYDHFAGRLGVALADALIARDWVTLAEDGGVMTPKGHAFLADFGAEPPPGKRVFCRACLDWSERRPHLAGKVGAALTARCFALGWVSRLPDTRAVAITTAGQTGFRDRFGVVAPG